MPHIFFLFAFVVTSSGTFIDIFSAEHFNKEQTRHYDWPGGKDGWDSVNDWNVVSYNIISNLSLSNPLYYIVLPQGDTMLDWGPDPEPGQGEHPYDPNNPDLVAPAMGNHFSELL